MGEWAYKQINGCTIDLTKDLITFDDLVVAVHDPSDDSIRVSAAMGVVQVSNTDDGLQAYGHNMTPAEARELARKITEAADALDPFTEEPDGADDWIDPPKCDECKGTGIDIVNQIDDCPKCLGAGY